MTLIQESYLIHLLNQCDAYSMRLEKDLKEAVVKRLQQIYKILKRNIRETFTNFSLDVIVRFTQISVQVEEKLLYAQQFVDLFFQRIQAPSQFYIRQLLVKAKVIALKGQKCQQKGEQILKTLKKSILYINKALDLISGPQQTAPQKGKDAKGAGDSSKSKYGFLVYNASTCLYKITRFLLRSSWQKNFTQIFERIFKLFEQLDQPAHNWRCRFSFILFQCLYDSQKKAEAFKILDALWQKTKTKNCDFQDSLFKLRIHLSKQNNAIAAVIKKDIQSNPSLQWGALQILQKMKSGSIPQAQIQKQLMTVVNTIHDGILSTNEQNSTILSPIKQQRLAQAGRIALKYNIASIASSITNFLSKARQPNQKAMVLNEYNKAELLIKKKGEFIDKKTGMMMSNQQIKALEIQYRKDALRILQKVMDINKKLDNADLIYEGAILIWNISLPFMCPQYRSAIIKPFKISVQLLGQIDSVHHDLRTKMHLQLAKIYFGNEAMFSQVEENIMKAIKLDPSIALHKINYKFQSSDDLSLYQRPYERYLEDFREKILLKTMQTIDPGPLDTVTQDLWNLADQKSETTRIDILQKCLKTLLSLEETQFKPNQEDMLVQEQISEKKSQFQRKKLIHYKRKKMLAAEIAEFAFEWDLNDFAKKACQLVLWDNWQPKNSIELIISQSKSNYFMAQMKIDELTNQNFEFCFQKPRKINQQEANQATEDTKELEITTKKSQIIQYLKKGLKLAQSIQQHWLIFNGSIYLWNNCLHIFRNPSNDSELKPALISLLQVLFQSMKKSLGEIQAKNIVYYDLDTKIQTYANIGLVFARIRQLQKKPDEVLRICEALLSTSLSPHTRKLINGIKARVQKSGGKAPDNKKGGKQPVGKTNSNDAFLLDIITQLEVIQNSNNKTDSQNLIKKCFQNLQQWKPKEQDQPELQLHAQMWVRLARLAINQQSMNMYKYCLRCCENSLFYLDRKSDVSSLPMNRLRWYSLAEFLYSQCLMKICNPDTQEPSNVNKIRFAALAKAVDAVQKGYKCNINALVLDGAKQVWNICVKLQQSQVNRVKLLSPVKSTLFYLKQMKEDSQVDLILLLSQLYFKASLQNNQFKAGEQMADVLLGLVPKNLQKSLWQAKMIFMSKQGKNQLHAISSMKQADPSLQAKLWVKLARFSVQPTKQHMAYNKALDILKKQHSVEIVEVLIQYAEWQSRVSHESLETVKSTLLLASDYLIDIQFGQDQDQEQEVQEQKGTVFSRSTRGKKSVASKSMKSGIKNNQAKKPVQRKGPLSMKSKGASSSRMNRSGRITKAAKSKNTKSIFSQKQQDPNPESLNCLHFERLFRIHTTLSLISQSQQQKIRYALDAKQFLVKMYHLSIKTLNELLQNAGKFSEKNDKKDTFKALSLPSRPQDWIRLQLSKQFIQRINNFQNFNFIGAYTFQKPQLTLIYLNHLLDILQEYGLSEHSLPVNFLARYVGKFILKNEMLYNLTSLKLKRTMTLINSPMIQEVGLFVDIESLTVTQTEYNKELQKAHDGKVFERNQNLIFQNNRLPTLAKPISNYEIWVQLGQVLIEQGRLSMAKGFLQKAQTPARILGNNSALSKLLKSQAKIHLYEGSFNQCIMKALQANKICKSLKSWPQLIQVTCQGLLQLKKFQNNKRFLSQVYQTLVQLIEESKDAASNKSHFQTQNLSLKEVLLLIQILKSHEKIVEILVDEASPQNIAELVVWIGQLKQSVFNSTEIKGNVRHFELFIKLARTIFKIFATGGGVNNIELNNSIFTLVFQIILKIQKNILEINKYCSMGEGKITDNVINMIHRQIRYLLVEGYQIKDLLREKDIAMDEQQNDGVDQLQEQNEVLRKYLQSLKKQIHKKMSPIPTNLQPSQCAISILQNLKPSVSKSSYQYVRWFSYYTLSQTLRAQSKEQLGQIWDQNSNLEEMNSQYGVLSLQTMDQFLEQCQSRLQDFQKDFLCYLNSERSYLSLINNCGMQLPDRCFQFLAKYQHSCYTESLIGILKQNIQSTHKYICGAKIVENMKIDSQIKQKLLKDNQILDSYSKFADYNDNFTVLPLNNLTIIIQLSRCKSEIYFGCYYNSPIAEERKYLVKKRDISKVELKTLLSMKKSINKVKKNMLKTPFQNSTKMQQTIAQNQNILGIMNQKFIEFNKWWLYEVLELINKPKQQTNEQVQTTGKQKDKKAANKDPKRKAGTKQEVSTYQSPLTATPAGLQSITFLLDSFLYDLPFQHLAGLQNVPAVSKDNSYFYLTRKLKTINFKPQLNNSNGFGADKGKYLGFDFKDQNLNFSNILSQLKIPNIKISGINSRQKVSSPGDFIQFISNPGFMQVYGNVSLLNRPKVPTIITCLKTVKNYLILSADNLNYRKQVQEKYFSLVQGNQAPLQKQEQILVAMMNLLNINLVKLRWSMEQQQTVNLVNKWYQKLNQELYIGNLPQVKQLQNHQVQDVKISLFSKFSTFLHGAPILRL